MDAKTIDGHIAKVATKYLDIQALYDFNIFCAIKSIIFIESGFNHRLITEEKSVKDYSIGLMQVRIDTARWVNGWWVYSDKSISTALQDPRTNIETGTWYLVKQLRRYDGDVDKAVAAYNAGRAKFKADCKCYSNQEYVTTFKAVYKTYKKRYFGGSENGTDSSRQQN